MSDFRKALLWTAIPIVVLSLISTGFVFHDRYGRDIERQKSAIGLWFYAVFYLVGATIGAIIYGLRGKRNIASGIWAGIGIGIISLGVTCFANIRI
jgi:lipid-binding SYLF domain-containing protein